MATQTACTVRDVIERDLADEPQSVVKVYETAQLSTDLREYVLTDQLAREFGKVVEAVVESAKPGGNPTPRTGVWISGFFGSGKSHFAKLAGHLLAGTTVGDETARTLFAKLLHVGRPADDRLRELLQEATNYRLTCHLVPFDIVALHAAAAEQNVGLTFLRAFYQSLGLSDVIPFAEREIDLQEAELYDAFLARYEALSGVQWAEDKDYAASSPLLAQCLAELLPKRYPTADLAHQSLDLAFQNYANLTIDGAVDRLLHWHEGRQRALGKVPLKIVFVADEVGAWAGRDLRRIEQIRSLIETTGARGKGKIWLLVTSQEKLSAVVQNAPASDERTAQELLQRLEARFQINVHLESSEVGTVIEDRVLRKKPSARPALETLWGEHREQLVDIAEPPGLEMGANYPAAERERFVKDYPFLPYQVPAAADIFGGMRGVKISSGARSMIKVVFDATRDLADCGLGVVVSWDQIFDSANQDNEFADEAYLGSQGLTYIETANRDISGAPILPSRVLKALWLVQQSSRIPRTERNLARLLVDRLDADVLQLERDVAQTLRALAEHNFVRLEVGNGQWRFLTQDEVTVEKILRRIGGDIRATDLRKATADLYSQRIQSLHNGRITVGKSATSFDYGVYLNGAALKNDQAPVQLRVAHDGTNAAREAVERSAVYLEDPVVYWVVDVAPRLEERLRRAMAIEKLPNDDEYRRVATDRMRIEAERVGLEADELRRDAASDVERALQGGTLYYAGEARELDGAGSTGKPGGQAAKSAVEEALRDRILVTYPRFPEGDRKFSTSNVARLFTAPPAERGQLDSDLALFGADGHLYGTNVLVETMSGFLKGSMKTTGQDALAYISQPPFGWPPDLMRYAAAAMFVDAKLSVVDKSGKRFDDPRVPAARALFETLAFRSSRLELEEEPPTPDELGRAWTVLKDFGQQPADTGEIAIKEAALRAVRDLTEGMTLVTRAREAGLPLPATYDRIPVLMETIGDAGSRKAIVLAVIEHGADLLEARAALRRLEEFDRAGGLDQYRRSQSLLQAALQAGLGEDPDTGPTISKARNEIQALKDQRRVLSEWDGAFRNYRQDVLDAFKTVYRPLREELHRRVIAARDTIQKMPEYQGLPYSDQARIRVEFLTEGKPLAEVSMPELRDEEQLLRANAEYSIAHLRTALAALDSQVGQAQSRVVEAHTAEQVRRGEAAKLATWNPQQIFTGKRFTTEAEVDAFFDGQKEELKALIRAGKTVQVV